MASITAGTLDHAKRTIFVRLNKRHVPVALPFQIVTVDEDAQFYEPQSIQALTDNGRKQRGQAWDVVYLDRNMALPRPAGTGNPDKWAVWSYYGI